VEFIFGLYSKIPLFASCFLQLPGLPIVFLSDCVTMQAKRQMGRDERREVQEGWARAGGKHREDGEDKNGGNEGDDSNEKEIEKVQGAEDTWRIRQIHVHVHLKCIDNHKK